MLASEIEVDFGIVLHDDNIVERTEDFSVSLLLPGEPVLGSNIFLGGVSRAVVYIKDDDGEISSWYVPLTI